MHSRNTSILNTSKVSSGVSIDDSLFVAVPREVLENVFKYLPSLDLVSCSLVCSRWHSIIMQNLQVFSKLSCFIELSEYPDMFDEENENQLKFKLFKYWDYYKRLLLYYNCSEFLKFESVTGVLQPRYTDMDLTMNWTPLRFFLVNADLCSIAINKKKDQLKLIKNRLTREDILASIQLSDSCTGCAIALIRDQIPLGLIKSFVYVYIMRPKPGVQVTLVSFNDDMSEHVTTELTVGDLQVDRDLGRGIKYLQVNGLAVLHNFILFEVNCFNLTANQAVSYSMVVKIKERAAMSVLELVGKVKTEQYNLNVLYHACNKTLYVLKCTHFKHTESLYSLITWSKEEFEKFQILDTSTRELKYYTFWLEFLIYVDPSRRRIYFWCLDNSQDKIVKLNDHVENNRSVEPLISVATGDILSLKVHLDHLYVHVSMGVTKILVYRLEPFRKRNTLSSLNLTHVTEFTLQSASKDVDIVGCHRKKFYVSLH